MLIGLSMFDDLYHDLFGDDDMFGPYALLQGLPNMTLQTNSALWELSRRALTVQEVRAILEERAAAEVVPALEGSPAGRAFLAELRAYLREYGQRGDKWMIDSPSWYEDPTPVIKNLKDYIAQSGDDPAAGMAARAAERERLIADARTRLAGYPQEVVGKFEFFLKAAQEANVISEDHGFWIDFRCLHQYRRVLMEFGRRFGEAGALRQAGDVFLLTPAEMRETAVALPHADRKALVRERQAEMARARAAHPPPALGTPPPGPPPDSPMQRAIGKFWGAPPQPETERGVLHGNAGSPGTARGPVRVVRSLGEAGLLQSGDILVAETTAPPWTPLFATAAAVVTDIGGILSHCAVVAREYRIPAVVGTGTATATLQDGQIVEVDGTAGTVRLVSHD
jgi:pyruvate,water dikinase